MYLIPLKTKLKYVSLSKLQQAMLLLIVGWFILLDQIAIPDHQDRMDMEWFMYLCHTVAHILFQFSFELFSSLFNNYVLNFL